MDRANIWFPTSMDLGVGGGKCWGWRFENSVFRLDCDGAGGRGVVGRGVVERAISV